MFLFYTPRTKGQVKGTTSKPAHFFQRQYIYLRKTIFVRNFGQVQRVVVVTQANTQMRNLFIPLRYPLVRPHDRVLDVYGVIPHPTEDQGLVEGADNEHGVMVV